MNYKELENICAIKLEELKERKDFDKISKRLKLELYRAKIAYEENFDVYEDLVKNKGKISNRYIIPYLLDFTDSIDLSKKIELKQVIPGQSSGIDIDTDLEPIAKEKVIEYLREKYGKDHVVPVGTYSTIGLASGIKDVLRKFEAPFKESNDFVKCFDPTKSFDKNIEEFEKTNKPMYEFYLKYKEQLDFVPKFQSRIKAGNIHAGGILITQKPINESLPIMRVQDHFATANVENGGNTELDELSFVKYDMLVISILEVFKNTIASIKEDLFEIVEDGIKKIVPRSYLDGKEIDEPSQKLL
jgi:hypothetical protein